MAKGAYIGVDNVARKIKKGYIGVENFVPRALPSGYTQASYIQSSGTQYVDTGFKPNQDTRVVMDAQILKDPGTSVAIYFGVRWDGGFFELYKAGSSANLTFLYNTTYSQYFTVDYTLRRTVEINKNTATVDGVTKSYPAGTFQSNLPLFLCADNEYGAEKSHTAMRLYSCQIYDNGTLVRDYVPCTNASGTAGLYDLVGAKFYANAGSGAFAAGSSASSVARKIKKAYIGIGGIARPCWSGEVEITYSGNMTDEVVTMSGKQYRLLTLTSSGTLTVSEAVDAEVWMCGGGTSGRSGDNKKSTHSAGGGGAGAFTKNGTVTLSGSMTAVIGAGGGYTPTSTTSANLGGSSSFAGLETSTAFSNYNTTRRYCGVCGGTGGGAATIQNSAANYGTGDGVSKYPFGDTTYFKPHCAGGGAGTYNWRGNIYDSYIGSNGGTNGGDSSWAKQAQYAGYTSGASLPGGSGGSYGGGAGGSTTYKSVSSYSATAGSAATFYGSGGGGGAATYVNSSYRTQNQSGAGYQGVIYIRIPLAA